MVVIVDSNEFNFFIVSSAASSIQSKTYICTCPTSSSPFVTTSAASNSSIYLTLRVSEYFAQLYRPRKYLLTLCCATEVVSKTYNNRTNCIMCNDQRQSTKLNRRTNEFIYAVGGDVMLRGKWRRARRWINWSQKVRSNIDRLCCCWNWVITHKSQFFAVL